jgi:glycosyltransferase involved in cell wall biosynthesis
MSVKKKKVAIIGTAGLPASYGGFETMTDFLTKFKRNEFQFYVFCGKTVKKNQLKEYNGAKLIYLPFNANGGQSILYDIVSITKSWFKYDALIILGTPGCIILPFLNLFKKTKTIVNFGGLEWKRDKWNFFIRKYLKFTEHIAIKNSSYVVADNQSFCNYINKEYFIGSELIEYGGDHVSHIKASIDLKEKYLFLKKSYFVSISRAQPDNNLHLLLEAFSKTPNKNLVLVSNWSKFDYGIKLKKQYSYFENIYIVDAIYDLSILDVIRSNAKAYIHSHTYCGTAPSLVEAMNLGLPIISYNVDTNLKTTENQAIYFSNQSDLIEILNKINDSEITDLGNKMKEIAKKRYTWKIISNKYSKLINS